MKKQLFRIIPSLDKGIFKCLYDIFGERFDWLREYKTLDLDYFGNHSGHKPIAPIIEMMLKIGENEVLSDEQMHRLAFIIYNTYNNKWEKYYALLQAKYNPIENYSMVENETPNLKRTQKATNDYEVTDEKKISTNIVTSASTSTSGSAYGFNSTSAVDTNEGNGSQRTNVSGDDSTNFEKNSHKQSGGLEELETGNRKLTRSGNIGVTTTQQMLGQEVEFWKWNFFRSVYQDVDAVLTLPIYEI